MFAAVLCAQNGAEANQHRLLFTLLAIATVAMAAESTAVAVSFATTIIGILATAGVINAVDIAHRL